MDTTLILYCAFSYLFMLGVAFDTWGDYSHVVIVIGVLIAPITFPLIAGSYLSIAAE